MIPSKHVSVFATEDHPVEVTEVTVELATNQSAKHGKVLAYVDFELNQAFKVREARLISSGQGRTFVAMPNRIITFKCQTCLAKNEATSNYCCRCGHEMSPARGIEVHRDIAYPVTSKARSAIEKAVFKAYQSALREAARNKDSQTAG